VFIVIAIKFASINNPELIITNKTVLIHMHKNTANNKADLFLIHERFTYNWKEA